MAKVVDLKTKAPRDNLDETDIAMLESMAVVFTSWSSPHGPYLEFSFNPADMASLLIRCRNRIKGI